MSDNVDALVIFGATGDLAKIETFPALVGLVKRGVLDIPVVGVAKSGWGLEQFRDYAAASLKLNGMDPADPHAVKMLSLLRYVDGDLGDETTYKAMSDQIGVGQKVLYYMEVPAQLFGRIAQGIAGAGRAARGPRVMLEKPFATSPTGAGSMTGPAPSGTCCRTTCCRCWPPCWPNRRPRSAWPAGAMLSSKWWKR